MPNPTPSSITKASGFWKPLWLNTTTFTPKCLMKLNYPTLTNNYNHMLISTNLMKIPVFIYHKIYIFTLTIPPTETILIITLFYIFQFSQPILHLIFSFNFSFILLDETNCLLNHLQHSFPTFIGLIHKSNET